MKIQLKVKFTSVLLYISGFNRLFFSLHFNTQAKCKAKKIIDRIFHY